MKTTKYLAVGATVQAVEATESNLEDLAEWTEGQMFRSPRDGQRYVLVETATGTARVAAGSWVFQRDVGQGPEFQVRSAEEFAAQYERP